MLARDLLNDSRVMMDKKMSKILAVLAFATGALFLANAANATPVTYILTLTATNPASTIASGSGSFSFDSTQFTGSGNEFFEPGSATKTLTSLSILIGGHTFDLSDAVGGYAQAFFQNGVFSGLIYN